MAFIAPGLADTARIWQMRYRVGVGCLAGHDAPDLGAGTPRLHAFVILFVLDRHCDKDPHN
jgi:hypothetical protein